MILRLKPILLIVFLMSSFVLSAQTLGNEAEAKIKILESLMSKAEKKGIDVLEKK